MKKSRPIIAVGFFATLFALLSLNITTLFAKEETLTQSRLESLAKFTKAIGTIESLYVDEQNISDIIDKSLEGLLSTLDAHSSYLSKKKLKDLKVQTEGEFGGLGITVGMRDGALTVIAPLEGTPADKAGLKAKDIILKIDDQSTLNMTIDEAVNLMRGKPKTKITLTIVRKGEKKPFKVDIVRDIIKIQSVYSKIIEGKNILYVRVTNFDKKVSTDVSEAIKKSKKLDGIILDLRNNPGGLLSQATGLSDLFIDDGVIVSQKGRIDSDNKTFKASKIRTVTNKPLVVLVNGGSASASEIVSGALQDHKRAVIIGEKTFGKGSVQAILSLDDDEALKLTVARYYLPSGRTIQAVGVTPDIEVQSGKVPQEEDDFMVKESELKKHLEGELAKIDPHSKIEVKKENKKDKNIITNEDIMEDIQLKTALDILKVLQINIK
jgi:carboxyl-terminal processing protease